MTHLARPTPPDSTRPHAGIGTVVDRAAREAGEGVISAAIVVLIMAIIGAAMWAAFNGVWQSAESTIESEVESIG